MISDLVQEREMLYSEAMGGGTLYKQWGIVKGER